MFESIRTVVELFTGKDYSEVATLEDIDESDVEKGWLVIMVVF